jgi:uncharacterized protein (DUF2336 family)
MDGDLTQKARDRSQAGRGELLEALMRSVIKGRRPTPGEAELFFDIARRLLALVAPEVRQLFAQQVATMRSTPVDVLMMLARDDGLIAAPVLRGDNALTETHLIDLSRTLPISHLADLAARGRLTVPVTDVLAKRGDVPVLRELAHNETSALSQETVARMVGLADGDEDLCRMLARRTDLPPQAAERLVQLMAVLLRGRLVRSTAPKADDADADLPSRAPLAADVTELVRQVKDGRITLDDVVARLAEEDRGNDIAMALARLTDVDELSTLKVLVRREPEGIVLVCKALDLKPSTWRMVVEFRRRRLKLSDSDVRFELRDYSMRTADSARATLSQFQGKRATAH